MVILYLILISYLLGSFPTAYLVVKLFAKKDIREVGSKNVGATNAFRALKEVGKEKLALIAFLIILIIDIAKGAGSIFFAQKFFSENLIFALILAGFFVVLGHNYSIFLKFSGGRGAACLMGILLYLDPLSLLVWGLPILFFAILAQIILEKMRKIERMNWKKFSEIFMMVVGRQMAGRMAGLILAPILLYFYDPQIFLPIAAGTILLLIKNIPRFEDYFKEICGK